MKLYTKLLNINLDPQTFNELKNLAEEKGLFTSQLARIFVSEGLIRENSIQHALKNTFKLDDKTLAELENLAENYNIDITNVIRGLIATGLKKENKHGETSPLHTSEPDNSSKNCEVDK